LGEYFKQALLRFTVENFREDLRKMLGLSLAHIKLKRDPGFEEFLKERKKRRRVVDPEEFYKEPRVFHKVLKQGYPDVEPAEEELGRMRSH
jgi:hypothetical protein